MGRIMTRSEAVAHVARADLALLPADERASTLKTMQAEDWDTDAGWQALPSDLREELEGGHLKADPSSSRYDAAILLYIAFDYRGATNDYLIRRLKHLGITPASITGRSMVMEACPCCGYRTLDERGHYDICAVCWWEDDGQDNETADQTWGGPNAGVSLSEARANFLTYGIYDPARYDLRPRQQPADKFAPARQFVLIDGDSVVEEPATGWRSRPLGLVQQTSESSENHA